MHNKTQVSTTNQVSLADEIHQNRVKWSRKRTKEEMTSELKEPSAWVCTADLSEFFKFDK